MDKPDLFVILSCDPKQAQDRILNRGREMEKDIQIDYLNMLSYYNDKM